MQWCPYGWMVTASMTTCMHLSAGNFGPMLAVEMQPHSPSAVVLMYVRVACTIFAVDNKMHAAAMSI